MKKILFSVFAVVLVFGMAACGEKKATSGDSPVSEKPMEEYGANSIDNGSSEYVGEDDEDPYTSSIANEIVDFYIDKVNEIAATDSGNELRYDLVFVDNNNTPELVVSNPGYLMRLYTYKDGKVVYALDDEDENGWPYGAAGNTGYLYAVKDNVILNYNTDYAGLVQYANFYTLKDGKIAAVNEKDLYASCIGTEDGLPTDGTDAEATLNASGDPDYKWFYDGVQISEDEAYAKYVPQVENDYRELYGSKTAKEILESLNYLLTEK